MHKNMNSPTKLTEFAPLSPEGSPPAVTSIFSKFFSFSKNSTPSSTEPPTPVDEKDSISETSEVWKPSTVQNISPSEDAEIKSNYSVDSSEGRSLPNVLKRISNIVAHKSNNLQSYNDSQLRSYWMPDNVSKQCYECGERFTTFRRRHHCRICGQIFCSKCCSDEVPGKIMGVTGDLRVCTYCCKVVLSYLQSSDMRSALSADLKALQEDLEEKYGNSAVPQSSKKSTSEISGNDTSAKRKPSVGYMEEKYAFGRTPQNLSTQERAFALQNSASLRMIYEEMFRSSQAITLQTHRIRLNRYYNCFLGNELVNWLISQQKAATRIQAIALGQALFEAGFIESVLLENAFSDSAALFKPAKLSRVKSKDFISENKPSCDAQEPAWVKTIPQYDSTTDSDGETKQPLQAVSRLPSSGSSFYLDLDLEASTVSLKRPTSNEILDFSGSDSHSEIIEHKEVNFQCQENSNVPEDLLNDTLLVQEKKGAGGWNEISNLKSSYGEASSYQSIASAYKQHEDTLIRQLLNKEGLSQSWSEIILRIAHQVVEHVRPDLHHDADDMDIRQYIQIKKSPGGNRKDCEIVSGIVCSKNVSHKSMNAMIANPKILLLRCGITYQRVEGKLLSLEPILMQESQSLQHTVARINSLRPDIVLVHKSVSRLAQDKLRQSGVTLVLNVKLSVLERLARCTGANIVDTIDAHISTRSRLGMCKKFYLRNFSAENTMKTLMFFEGCANPHLGGTVLLRGGSAIELKKVKKVTSMIIFSAYSYLLEKSFLMDEFARPPSPKDNSFLDDSSRNSSPSKSKKRNQSTEPKAEKSAAHKRISFPNNDHDISEDESNNDGSLAKYTNTSDEASNEQLQNQESRNFNRSSMDTSNYYDTLKLFKSKPKSSSDGKNDKDSSLSIQEKYSESEIDNTLELFSRNSSSSGNCNQSKETASGSGSRSSREAVALLPSSSSGDEKQQQQPRAHGGESVSDRSDPLHQYLNEDEDDDNEVFHQELLQPPVSSPNGQRLSVAELPLLNNFKKSLEGTVLSISPYVKFSIPYLETELGRHCVLRSFFPKELYYSAYFSEKMEAPKSIAASEPSLPEGLLTDVNPLPAHSFVTSRLTKPSGSQEIRDQLAHFRACGGRLPKVVGQEAEERAEKLRAPLVLEQQQQPEQAAAAASLQAAAWPDCLDSASHQRLSVLFCSFLRNTSTNNTAAFCVNPWVVNMDLYGRNDIPLGRFLERYCLTTEYKCPAQNCRAQIAQHVRRFVHDGGCVYISLSEMNTDPFSHLSQDNPKQIFMWSKCSKCKSVSAVVPISEETWSLSFAKYLELRFHASVYTRRGGGATTTDTGTSQCCQHSLHHDHQQYFSRRNMLACVRYSRVSQWEISLPPPLIDVGHHDPRLQAGLVEETRLVALKGDEVFSQAKDRIAALQLDEASAADMIKRLAKDQQYFKSKMEELQLKLTSPSLSAEKSSSGSGSSSSKSQDRQVQSIMHRVEDNIVILKRLIAEMVQTWNTRLAEAVVRRKEEKQSSTPVPARKTQPPPSLPLDTSDCTTTEDSIAAAAAAATADVSKENQSLDDTSPVSADFNAVDAIAAIQQQEQQSQRSHALEYETHESVLDTNPEEIVVIQGSPKVQNKLPVEIIPSVPDEPQDKKKKKKTILSQVWSSTPNTQIITNPLGTSEHHLLPLGSVVPIIVYESEPSSIIAYALDSHDYKHTLQEQLRLSRGSDSNSSPLNKRKNQENKDSTSELTQSGESKRPSVLSFLRGNSPNPNYLGSPVDIDKSAPTSEMSPPTSASATEFDDEKKSSNKQQQQQNYIEVQFADSTTNFYCRIYFAAQFAALRESVLLCGEDGYTRSLARSIQWAARGGKSGSTFSKTRDDRFILKEMTRMDLQIFLDFAPNYFAYMEKCQQTKQPTLLGKIVGIYRVSFKNNTTNAALRTSVLVMENLFYNRSITDKFDLKGSQRNRLVNLEDFDHEGELVLLDENLLNMSCDSPLYIRPHAKAVLNKAIEEDTKFLADNCVMDYSLLVGLEPNSDELVIGIIDYLRTFTWDKKIETMVKKSGILGGQGKLPTIVSPVEYRSRFITAMHKYFLPVPDRWTGLSRGVTVTQ
ncbi:1-phosphatidylinositol 3-phosphate 5-kinase isoform X2 [Trichogramma pretiosum]|uniref:1-phosphatidylinositol 3-phosphate 5-kinase isoform X2 n=1 Tax=Trichogramma pretiosum TaxID=7493 RepID=UPI000C71B7B7|nr:1-phosphatidylinositol 3-phosphate 5-kinase isoform X2 [Trichogramma pretiosum]